MTMQSLYGSFIGFWLSSKGWLGTIYASFGIPRIEWVLYMCPLEFWKIQDFSTSNSYVQLQPYFISKKIYLTTNYCQEWHFGFSFNCLHGFFFKCCRHLVVLGSGLSFDDSQVNLTLCSLNLVAPEFTYLELYWLIY
jgi:hypothetical protein